MSKFHSQHLAYQAIHKSLIKEQWLKLGIGLFLTALGLLGLLWTWGQVILVAVSLILLMIGIYVLSLAVKGWEVEEQELMQTLLHHPQQIVWVYSVVTQRIPFGFEISNSGVLFFKLIDGNEFSVELPHQDLTAISKSLNQVLPHATFGFTKDREQWYLASPELLRKEGGEQGAK